VPTRVTAPASEVVPALPPAPPIVAAPSPVVPATTDSTAASVGSTTVPTDCASGGDRAMRIAKPGGIGGLLGAAVGAAGGAIAGGGKGAGKGALIGAGVGAVAGGAYGAYRTQKDCGTILGSSGAAGIPVDTAR
jgi:outer membrane protein with glycine zipper